MQHRNRSRLLTLATLILMLAFIGGNVIQAQDDCFGLAQADCDILNAANANMADVSSFTYDLSTELSMGGMELLAMMLPGLPGGMSLSLESDGTFDGNGEALEIFFDVSAEMGMESAAASATLILVDEVAYIITEEGKAFGVKPSDLDTDALPVDIDMEALDMMELTETLSMDAFTGLFTDFGMDPSEYTTFARLDDVEMMGQTMYPFEFSMDIGGLLNSPEFMGVIGMLAGVGAEDPSMAGIMEMVPMLMAGIQSEMSMTEYIGADGYVHGVSIAFDFAMDLSALFGPGEPIEIALVLDMGMDNINSAPSVSAPSDVTILSEDEAEQMLTEMFSDFEDLFAGLADMLP